MSLSTKEIDRYQPHLLLPEIGFKGQLLLKKSRVLIVGVGGLGCPASLYLAAAGVGHLGLIDGDQVSLNNLQRQILYSTDQVSLPKVQAAQERLHSLNPEVHVEIYPQELTPQNARDLFQKYDIILDGTDNFKTRYVISDACTATEKPHVYGAVSKFDGQASLFFPPQGPCYRCLYPQSAENCQAPTCGGQGVLGVLPGLVGTLQATEVLKFILKIGNSLLGRLLILDTLDLKFSSLQLQRDLNCLGCRSP